jgi:hypothetical protein
MLATLAGAALILSSLAAATVASRNADTIAEARDHGLGMARATTDFRTHLASADALAAATLISGGLETTEQRAAYDTELLAASEALTDAGLAATDDDRESVNALSDGLVQYAGLVETSRANSRQGFPVGAAYLDQARAQANDTLAPQAEQLRRVGEQRMARAANSVGGLLGVAAVVLLVLGIAVLVGCGVVVAGRTRKFAHPAILLAGVAAVVGLVIVTGGILAQGNELRKAATGDVDRYVEANEAANLLADLRVTEISAVAAKGSGLDLYNEFAGQRDILLALDIVAQDQFTDRGVQGYADAVWGYSEAVVGDQPDPQSVSVLDLEEGDNDGAAASTLSGASKEAFDGADDVAGKTVDAADAALAERLDAASAANVSPLFPILLGVLAAVLAVAGILSRGRKYR